MKRKKIGLFILVSMMFVVGSLSIIIIKIIHKKAVISNYEKHFNQVKILSIKNQEEIIKSKNNIPFIVFFFNSECDHCQAEAKLIQQEHDQLTNANLYFLSTEPIRKIKEFGETYGLDSISNLTLGQVDGKEVFEKFGVNTFPMVFIYSEDGELLKKYTGEVKIEAITKYL